MIRQEEKIGNQQSQTFTGTLSHEMRTPIATSIFLIEEVTTLLGDPDAGLVVALKYLDLIRGQLNFTMSFVDDLLDLRQLKEGVFKLTKDSFKPSKVF